MSYLSYSLFLPAIFGTWLVYSLDNNTKLPRGQNSTTEDNSGSTNSNGETLLEFLFDSCNSTSQCLEWSPYSICIEGTNYCGCLYGYNSVTNQCKGVPPGKPCNSTAECLAGSPYSVCSGTSSNGTSGICTCLYGNADYYDNCPAVPAGKPCNKTSDCRDGSRLSQCDTSGVCACLYGDVDPGGKCPGYSLGERCNSSEQCAMFTHNSKCNGTGLGNTTGTCICPYGRDLFGFCSTSFDVPRIDIPSVLPMYFHKINYDSDSSRSSYVGYYTGFSILAFICTAVGIACRIRFYMWLRSLRTTAQRPRVITVIRQVSNGPTPQPIWTTQQEDRPPSYDQVVKQDHTQTERNRPSPGSNPGPAQATPEAVV